MTSIREQFTQTCDVDPGAHVIADIVGSRPGALLIAVGGLHGNEPAGVLAARRVAASLTSRSSELAGRVVLLAGNTRALAAGVRFVDADLNRHWSSDRVVRARAGEVGPVACAEDVELRELLADLDRLLASAAGEVYVLDMHTTSAAGAAFATLGDTLRNRRLASAVPVTIVLGIEEQLDGTMLEHMNDLGCVTLGFEAGQHESPSSVDNHEALLWIALVAAGNLRREDVPSYTAAVERLEAAGGGARFVEVRYRHPVRPGDEYETRPGLSNFTPVRRGQPLADDWRGPVRAPESGLVLMPLYQPLGDDGFFLVREVHAFWLHLSAVLRRLAVADYADRLPGVRRLEGDVDVLIVNTKLARLFPLQLFHLFGFRKQRWADDVLVVRRRRYDLRGPVSFAAGGRREASQRVEP